MAYSDIALLANDADFAQRTVACVATEQSAGADIPGDPGAWQATHTWQMASQPGFGDAYASAIAGEVDRPGNDQSVISDSQILAAVQTIVANETPSPEGE